MIIDVSRITPIVHFREWWHVCVGAEYWKRHLYIESHENILRLMQEEWPNIHNLGGIKDVHFVWMWRPSTV